MHSDPTSSPDIQHQTSVACHAVCSAATHFCGEPYRNAHHTKQTSQQSRTQYNIMKNLPVALSAHLSHTDSIGKQEYRDCTSSALQGIMTKYGEVKKPIAEFSGTNQCSEIAAIVLKFCMILSCDSSHACCTWPRCHLAKATHN